MCVLCVYDTIIYKHTTNGKLYIVEPRALRLVGIS